MPTTTETAGRERLATLARLLHGSFKADQALPMEWDFSRALEWRNRKGVALKTPRHSCRTVGCAIGQYYHSGRLAPATARHWGRLLRAYASRQSDPLVTVLLEVGRSARQTFAELEKAVCAEFGLAHDEFEFMFMPYSPADSGSWLTIDAKPNEVAWVIWFFLHHGHTLSREGESKQAIIENSVRPHLRKTINDPWMDYWNQPAEIMLRKFGYLT